MTKIASRPLSALEAAARVLEETGRPMSCAELIAAMAAQGYWQSPAGKTPAATLASALLRHIQTKGPNARFRKVGPGRFALNHDAPGASAHDPVADGPQPRLSRAQRRRHRLFARLLSGCALPEELARLDADDREIAQRLAQAEPSERQTIWQGYLAGMPSDEAVSFNALVRATDPHGPDPDHVATVADLRRVVAPVRWLWPDWIPLGMLSFLAGGQGDGKTALALGGIARPVLTGCPWPDGTPGPEPGRVLWCDTEAAQAVLCERIAKYGLPDDRILLHTADPLASLRLDDRHSFDELCESVLVQRPALVVIDSLRMPPAPWPTRWATSSHICVPPTRPACASAS